MQTVGVKYERADLEYESAAGSKAYSNEHVQRVLDYSLSLLSIRVCRLH